MSKKVPVQRGAIDPNMKTRKTMTPKETAMEDYSNQKLRHDGQQCGYMTPKQSKK